MGMMKICQINLGHSKCASDNLIIFLQKNNIDIGLIQEPWVRNSKVMGLNNKSFNLFYSQSTGKCRSCILVKKHINAYLLSNLSTPDLTAIKVESQKDEIILASAYMAHDKPAPPEEVAKLVADAGKGNANLVLGCDANARHTLWGSSMENERGEKLFDYLIHTNIQICNKGTVPTFIFPSSDIYEGWEEVLDITICNNNSSLKVDNWKVDKNHSFTQHKYITYEVNVTTSKPEPTRNPRKINWSKFDQVLSSKLKERPNLMLANSTELDNNVEVFNKAIKVAYEASCPIKYGKKTLPPWWNENLSNLRKKARKAFNQSYKSSNFNNYKENLKEYKTALRRAKRSAWRQYCESIETIKDSARLGKILSKEPSCPTYIKKTDDEWTNSAYESLELLMNTHFPGCKSVSTYEEHANPSFCKTTSNWNELNEIITKEKLTWAIDSFSPYKSPGPDGIIPIMLQRQKDRVIPWLLQIFKCSLSRNYVPKAWRRVRVVFIPKIGRRGHESPKDFRPLSLTSFVLKTLERLMDIFIRGQAELNLCRAQHAYLKGKSTETALHEVVRTIEYTLNYKQYTMATFLDIEGAFNNVSIEAIAKALDRFNTKTIVKQWILSMLRTRTITSSMGHANISKQINRGTPQGGVISPLLWLLVVDEVINELSMQGIQVVAYADDLVILVSGICLATIREITERALKILSAWTVTKGLSINPSKTELMLFTKKTSTPPMVLPKMNGVTIKLSKSVKFLGQIFDPKLNWRLNVENRVRKANIAFYACSKMFGRRWGLQPKMIIWMYTAVVRPILTYGATTWWPAIEKKQNISAMDKIQRTAMIGATGALRTCPTNALNVILHLMPIDLHIKSEAAISAIRLKDLGLWKEKPYGHTSILRSLPRELVTQGTDYRTPIINFDKNFRVIIPTREQWENGEAKLASHMAIFTDGSKMNCGVGAGVFIEELNTAASIHLPSYSSVFQAEVTAIKTACLKLRDATTSKNKIAIYTDSQAAIMALQSCKIASKVVEECKNYLVSLASRFKVTLVWVPGHRDIAGNERADELARQGAQTQEGTTEDVFLPLRSVRERVKSLYLQEADNRWKNLPDCKISRKTWPSYNLPKTKSLIQRPRLEVSKIIAIHTGHWPIGTHAAKMNIPFNVHCRSCKDPEEAETLEHYICKCPALAKTRQVTLGSYFLNNIDSISGMNVGRLINYVNKTKWLP
jgi:ribonuclease HI